ncbi:MAG TPA: hypothetical protein VJ505_09975 [Holophagaceae bacterium]|nr:hypothetical protein [Holophagaceae bacterium]
MRRSTPMVMSLLMALPLGAQEKIRVAPPSEAYVYLGQLRASRADRTLKDWGANGTGGGAGFAMLLGTDPLKLRLRMDGDTWSGQPATGSIQSIGLTTEAFLEFDATGPVTPFISAGPAFQHWILGSNPTYGAPRTTLNKLAFRAEAGIFIHQRFGFSLGALTGSLDAGQRTTVTYLAFTFR